MLGINIALLKLTNIRSGYSMSNTNNKLKVQNQKQIDKQHDNYNLLNNSDKQLSDLDKSILELYELIENLKEKSENRINK